MGMNGITGAYSGNRYKMFQKVIVIGSPGAGKSTFSRKLRDMTGLPLYYLDMLWHKPDKTTILRQEFEIRTKSSNQGQAF